ncbi:MAG TPA: threonine/serine exporter family protein [Rhodopila sp.]
MDHGADDGPHIEKVAHATLQAGRLLLLNGADTATVEATVVRFAAVFGCEAHLMVSYEVLLLTVVAGEQFRTKIGSRVAAMNVGMTTITAVRRVLDDLEHGRMDLGRATAALDAAEHRTPEYAHWLVVAMLGLTAASLSRLFGGDWPAFAVAWLAGAAGTWLRQQLSGRQVNPVAVSFLAACLSGLVGGAAVSLKISGTPSLCLVAPGMIIVPGVPLINGVQDMIRNHMTLGISRLAFGGVITVAIAMGLFVATVVTGAAIAVEAQPGEIGVAEDAVFSAIAALGYASLFNVPVRIAWACVVCGVASHALRTLGLHLGIDILSGTLLGALAAGILAQLFSHRFNAPAAAFAFPGVVAMVPGAYAFRLVLSGLQIAHGATDPALPMATLTLGITVVLMMGAIAVGIAAPAFWFRKRSSHPDCFPQQS